MKLFVFSISVSALLTLLLGLIFSNFNIFPAISEVSEFPKAHKELYLFQDNHEVKYSNVIRLPSIPLDIIFLVTSDIQRLSYERTHIHISSTKIVLNYGGLYFLQTISILLIIAGVLQTKKLIQKSRKSKK